MKLRYVVVLLLFPPLLICQVNLGTSSPSPTNGVAGQGRASNGQVLSLTGKVTTEGGSSLGEGASVVLDCRGSERGRVNADSNGNFVVSVTLVDIDPGQALTSAQPGPGTVTSQDWNQCELYADAPGYVSERLRMFGAPGFGVVEVGTVIMHPLAKTDSSGPSIDVASLAAPAKAKKDFERGQEQAKKGRWQAACEYFRKAVAAYPRYPLAWLELGRSQLRQNDFNGAQQSFQQATKKDPRLLDAYVEIARIAVEQRQWKQLADATGRIVQLAPDTTPNFWFLNSAANFNLGNIPQAESSATHALRMDSRHEVPQIEYLYSMILARRGDYNSAILHMKTYLLLSPYANDSADAQTKLADLEKLASARSTASR